MELSQVIQSLSRKRPVFHSEADFQHALAWEIQSLHPDSQIRLEYVIPKLRYHMDILVHIDGSVIPIELKYKTRKSSFVVSGEPFDLSNHGAQDIGRYDFAKDICRVEQSVSQYASPCGYAILLTNEPSYWQPGRSLDTIDADFKLHDGRTLSGTLAWKEHAGAGTTKGRTEPLSITGIYQLNWEDYSHINDTGAGRFRYLTVRVEQLSVKSF